MSWMNDVGVYLRKHLLGSSDRDWNESYLRASEIEAEIAEGETPQAKRTREWMERTGVGVVPNTDSYDFLEAMAHRFGCAEIMDVVRLQPNRLRMAKAFDKAFNAPGGPVSEQKKKVAGMETAAARAGFDNRSQAAVAKERAKLKEMNALTNAMLPKTRPATFRLPDGRPEPHGDPRLQCRQCKETPAFASRSQASNMVNLCDFCRQEAHRNRLSHGDPPTELEEFLDSI